MKLCFSTTARVSCPQLCLFGGGVAAGDGVDAGEVSSVAGALGLDDGVAQGGEGHGGHGGVVVTGDGAAGREGCRDGTENTVLVRDEMTSCLQLNFSVCRQRSNLNTQIRSYGVKCEKKSFSVWFKS